MDIRRGRGKELWQRSSLVKHTMGAEGPVPVPQSLSCHGSLQSKNSKLAEKNEYDPDCCLACEKFRKLEGEKGADTKGVPL